MSEHAVQRVVLLFLLASALAPAIASAEDPASVIRPGDRVFPGCTLNVVLDDPDGTVYMVTAGHCVQQGQDVRTGGILLGTVVLVGEELDVALIEIDPDVTDRIRPGVRGHEESPTGVTAPDETDAGDLLLLSGHGTVVGNHEATRENRSGVLLSDNETTYRSYAVVAFGDSGGPVIHAETGQALGVVSRFGIEQAPPANLVGPTIQGSIELFAEHGYDLTVRTVPS